MEISPGLPKNRFFPPNFLSYTLSIYTAKIYYRGISFHVLHSEI